jgi:hypothetical protein
VTVVLATPTTQSGPPVPESATYNPSGPMEMYFGAANPVATTLADGLLVGGPLTDGGATAGASNANGARAAASDFITFLTEE